MGALPRVVSAAGGAYLAWIAARLLREAFAGREARELDVGPFRGRADAAHGKRASGLLPGALHARLYDARTIEDRVRLMSQLIRKGGMDPQVHVLAGNVLRCGVERGLGRVGAVCRPVPEKNWGAEAAALHNYVQRHVRYMRDQRRADTFKSARRTLEMGFGDCLPAGTLLLVRGRGFVPIEDVHAGDDVMGDGEWTRVVNWWPKGVLDLIALRLNNGSTLRCTPDHRLFAVPMKRVGPRGPSHAYPLHVGDRQEAVEVLAGDVEEGFHLLTPERLPIGRECLGADRAWLLGVFAADGWIEDSGNRKRAAISGKDGHPKEAQKRRVAEICARLGVDTYWHERYIRISDADLSGWLGACGRGAPNKRLPTLDVDEESARALLEGLQADSAVNKYGTRTYGTTSPELALQIRVLHRMLGERVNIRRVDKHGGLGTHPIYRVSVVRPLTSNGRRGNPYAIVRGVSPSVAAPVYDIETESGRFYLPEHDLVVHNCDDAAIALGALLEAAGFPVGLRVVHTKGAPGWNHVYDLVGLPPHKPPRDLTSWVPLDASMKGARYPAGWEAPHAARAERTGRPAGMVLRARSFRV